jgi:iron complex outermembrane receptor protein
VNYGNAGGTRDTNRTLDQLERVRELGGFAQVTVPLSARTAVTAGARYDHVGFEVTDRLITATNPDDSGERPMGAASGSLGVTWRAHPRAVVYANAGTVFETPTTTELANRPTGAGGFNDSLGPQRAWMLEAGVRWNAGNGARATLAVFRADVRDALVPYEVPAAPQRRFFRNAGRSVNAGIEAGVEAQAAPWLSVRASYAWSRFRYADYDLVTPVDTVALDGRALPGVPEHRAFIGAELRPRTSGVWADAEVVLTSSVLVDDTLSTRAEGWSVVNLRAGWEGRAGGTALRPFATLQNAFNAHYVGSVVINAAGGRYYEPAPGRSLFLGLEIGGGR